MVKYNASFPAIHRGTGTSRCPRFMREGMGMASFSAIRDAITLPRQSMASSTASCKSLPSVWQAGKSGKLTISRPSSSGRKRAGYANENMMVFPPRSLSDRCQDLCTWRALGQRLLSCGLSRSWRRNRNGAFHGSPFLGRNESVAHVFPPGQIVNPSQEFTAFHVPSIAHFCASFKSEADAYSGEHK